MLSTRQSGSRGTLAISHGRARPASTSQRALGVLEVLEHLAADDQLGGVRGPGRAPATGVAS